MSYDFNSLTKQANEAINRDKFYTDFEDVDPNVLHQITELTDWIRTKGKGSDVREVIAQLFERTWVEGIKEGNANMEVAKARGTYNTLGDRLDNFNTEVRNIVSGSPKGTFSSLADLQSAKPNGDTGIYITTDNGHWWYWSGSWKDGGLYLSEPNSKNFLGFTIDTKFIAGEYVNAVTGELLYETNVVTTDFIDLSDFKDAIWSEIFIGQNHHASFFDSNKDFISGVVYNVVGPWEILIPSGAKYAKVAFYHSEINKVYIKKTNESSAMKYVDKAILDVESQIGTVVDYKTLPGEYYNIYEKKVLKLDGVISTDFIDISTFKGKLYTVINKAQNHHAAFFDANKAFISGVVSNIVGPWAIPIPSGAKYAKIAFYDEEEGTFYVRKLATDNIFEALPENYTYSLKGKKLGIIGDSISTYNGHIPTGYEPYYPAYDVTSVDSTWWKQLINNTGMELCVNASWSGSTITGDQDNTTGFVGCSDARVNALTASNGDAPDIIIVYIGINDFGKNNGAVCGNYRGKTAISQERNVTSISDAFGILLSKLQTKYPKAKIFVSRIMPERYAGSMSESHVAGFPNINPSDNVSLPAFNEQIEEIASAFNCPVIPMDKAGITFFNVSQYTGDNLHPKFTYMTMMAKIVQKVLEEYIG
ncbi:SGNH/GDSL hydrolase family protein [Streptococcus lutetiensis]|uniref:SGNH/GDSL hydrolase family protein n=1 Tax=Streptococcus lutetiensis TaxID=150055 RepID=UPI000FE21EB0|nr:SGNH/GDSL hydrolase family protein [Streptococcus lutetiensis]RHB84887.1 hypothetical protein DW868_04205 [Streptococcus lutetiensis]